ncbi:MAG: hypothetical protein JJV91_00640 [Desulfosarcina sp.]|nr:hypothetical protein [Desulfobacterales bacterium]
MGYGSSINGLIKGITKDSFELIKEELEEVFETVSWNNNAIKIDSYGKNYDANMFPVYDKIAFCIDGNAGGELNEEGDEQFDCSIIFFRHRQWKQVWVEVNFPKNPFIES